MRNIIYFFKVLFFAGLILLLFSCFLEWYSLRIYDASGHTIIWWNYYLFEGWTSPLSDLYNLLNRPNFSIFPLSTNIALIVLIIVSGYIVFFHDIERIASKNYRIIFGYGITALPMLLLYYLWMFPWYLGGFFYPNINVVDPLSGRMSIYSIGLGNILFICSFPLIFAYSFFYFVTVTRFEKKNNTAVSIVDDILQHTQEEIDLDKLIAEEQAL